METKTIIVGVAVTGIMLLGWVGHGFFDSEATLKNKLQTQFDTLGEHVQKGEKAEALAKLHALILPDATVTLNIQFITIVQQTKKTTRSFDTPGFIDFVEEHYGRTTQQVMRSKIQEVTIENDIAQVQFKSFVNGNGEGKFVGRPMLSQYALEHHCMMQVPMAQENLAASSIECEVSIRVTPKGKAAGTLINLR